MGRRSPHSYRPDPDRQRAYDALYREYRLLHERLGEDPSMLHRLRRIRNEAMSK